MYFKEELEIAIVMAEDLAAKGDYLGAIYKLTDALRVVQQQLPDEQ